MAVRRKRKRTPRIPRMVSSKADRPPRHPHFETVRFQLLHQPRRRFARVDPVLLAGEVAICDVDSDSPDLRVGDGKRRWSELPRFVPESEP